MPRSSPSCHLARGTLSVLHSFSGQDGALVSTGLLPNKQTALFTAHRNTWEIGLRHCLRADAFRRQLDLHHAYEFRSDADGCFFPQTQVQFWTRTRNPDRCNVHMPPVQVLLRTHLQSAARGKNPLYKATTGYNAVIPTDGSRSQDGSILVGLVNTGDIPRFSSSPFNTTNGLMH